MNEFPQSIVNYIIRRRFSMIGWATYMVIYGDRPKLAKMALRGLRKKFPDESWRLYRHQTIEELVE